MSEKKMVCAGNWKLHKNPEESLEFLNQLGEQASEAEKSQMILFPPATSIQTFSQSSPIAYGPQNIWSEEQGAFTGEVSATVCKGMGCRYALIGHSERRTLYAETLDWTEKKVSRALASGLVPVLCVGETLEQREQDQTDQVITEQLLAGLKSVESGEEFLIAYEPVWAIGTGKVASPDQAEAAHKTLRAALVKRFDRATADTTSILYGGSVKPENSKELGSQENIDGFLIGGASLKVESFLSILKNSQSS